MHETKTRSILKTCTWRCVGVLSTIALVYIYNKNIKEAIFVGMGVDGIKMLLFYLHERFWNRVHFGRVHPPDYEI